MTKPFTSQTGTPLPIRGMPTPAILQARAIAAATRRREMQRQQDQKALDRIKAK